MDFIRNVVVDPFMGMLGHVTVHIPTLVSVLFIFTLGVLLAKLICELFGRALKFLQVDKYAGQIGLSDALKSAGVKHGISHIITSFVYLVVIFIFLIMTVKALGLSMLGALIHNVFGYIDNVIYAVFILVFGLIVANIVGSIVHVVTHLAKMPKPKLYERITRWAVILHVITITLGQLNYGYLLTGDYMKILFIGIVFAYSLSYGLSGKAKF